MKISVLVAIMVVFCYTTLNTVVLAGESASGTQVFDKDGSSLGTVEFPTSCTKEAQAQLHQGLALLHHMNYANAELVFLSAADADPECAMAYWGAAMTYVHPLWPDTISTEKRAAGQELLEKAGSAVHSSDREAAYVAALKGYYEGVDRGEKERLKSFLEGWRSVHANHPNDTEAALFHALALLANAAAEDKTYANQIQAGEILQEVLGRIDRHPGAHHYTIHAYDVPPLAERALDIARRYNELAPENTHALHMTSHIFTRLGLWPESIEFNERGAAAASKRTPAGQISIHYLHALDYLAYAHLQMANDDAAERVLNRIMALEPP